MKKIIILLLTSLLLLFSFTIYAINKDCIFETGDDGKQYWYENNIKQGIYGSKGNVFYDGIERGREIYDPNTNAWYWLDALYDGAKAVNKEVFMPYIYQNENELLTDEYETKTVHHDAVVEKVKVEKGYYECVPTDPTPIWGWAPGLTYADVAGTTHETHPDLWVITGYNETCKSEWRDQSYYEDKIVAAAWDEEVLVRIPKNDESLRALAEESNIYTESNITANMSDQVYMAMLKGTGKWVRYDSEGKMIKGWYKVEEKDRQYYPDQVGNIYFYDYKTGLMAKGKTIIDNKEYYFDEVSGVLNENILTARRY